MRSRILRIFSRPSLTIIYGRPGSFKTALSLWAASHVGGRRVYVALGKHIFIIPPRGVEKRCVWDFRRLAEVLLEAYASPPDMFIVDGLESLLTPLRGYVEERAISQEFLFTAYTLLAASRRGCRCILTLEGGLKPSYTRLVQELDARILHLVAQEDGVKVVIRDKRLEALGRILVQREEILGLLRYGGGDATALCEG